jgi:general secretion pathway protein A
MATAAAVVRVPGPRQMYEVYWELRRPPFRNVPDPAVFCPLPAHQDALERLGYAVQSGQGGVVITGEPGCGKSTLSRVFLLTLDAEKYDVGLVMNPALSPDDFLYEVATQLDLAPATTQRVALFRALSDHLLANAHDGRSTVLIVDEAHLVGDAAVFEDLRILSNLQANDRYLVSLVLLGLPLLRTALDGLDAFRQRMAFCLTLDTPGEAEIAQYIDFRLERAGATRPLFTEEAVRAIYKESRGILRNVNKLCDICLYEGQRLNAREVNVPLVRAAAALA